MPELQIITDAQKQIDLIAENCPKTAVTLNALLDVARGIKDVCGADDLPKQDMFREMEATLDGAEKACPENTAEISALRILFSQGKGTVCSGP